MSHLIWRHPGARYLALLAFASSIAPVANAHAPAEGQGGEAAVLALLVLFGLAYATGFARMHRHVTARRGFYWRALAFSAGWAVLALALLSPLDTAATGAFSLHMVQHEILMLIAAPLLVLGRGLPTMLWAFPHDARLALGRGSKVAWLRSAWRGLTAPLSAWLLHAAALWIWHIPALFNAALADRALHDLQLVSFLATALIFWHALLRHGAHPARGAAIVYLFTTTIHTGVLGALLTFARHPLYAPFDAGLRVFGTLTPLEDQQLGGLIMWVPGALVYTGVALTLIGRWLGESARAAERS
jgi:putative membrane protein